MNYSPIRLLGQGGYGAVWLVRDESGHHFAMKIVEPIMEHVRALRDEVRRLLHLRGKRNIVQVLDYNLDAERPFYIMELADGALQDAIKGPMDPWVAAGILKEIIVAVRESHAQGIVHRDIKPANILLKGGGYKLADYGLAKGRGSIMMTMGAGTPGYMAPEQYRGAPTMASDIYGIGATLWHMLTGVAPPQDVANLDPRKRRPACPRALAEIVRWMTAAAPEQRPGLTEAEKALFAFLSNPRPPKTATAGEFVGGIAVIGALVWGLSAIFGGKNGKGGGGR